MSHIVTLFSTKKYFSDMFNRLDNSTTLGAADTGQLWTPLFGTWGISSGRAYSVTNGAGNAVVGDVGVADFKLTYTINGYYGATDRSLPQFIFRGLDATNFLYLNTAASNAIAIAKNDAGTFTTLANQTVAGMFVDGVDTAISILCIGNLIKVSVNGVQRLNYTLSGGDTKYSAYTKIGPRLSNGGSPAGVAKWDDIVAEGV